MRKELKPGRLYIIVNLDEPYAEAVYEVVKAGQLAKVALGENAWPEGDVDFQTWVRQTFPGEDGRLLLATRALTAEEANG